MYLIQEKLRIKEILTDLMMDIDTNMLIFKKKGRIMNKITQIEVGIEEVGKALGIRRRLLADIGLMTDSYIFRG